MSNELKLDARKWRFLSGQGFQTYAESDAGKEAGIKAEPLNRQFRTAREILSRFQKGRGVLLADDVGLGKTTIGALVAWVVACQDKRVRIYAPNAVLRERWEQELKRHVPMLCHLGARNDRIKRGDVGKLNAGRIQVATHHALVKSHGNSEQRTACDLMIIDEAHRAKGDGSEFSEALRNLGGRAKRKLILTATPFSIRLAELEQLLQFVGATELGAVRRYAVEIQRLYSLGEGRDATDETKRLVEAAKEAIKELQPYLIRHGIEDLSEEERTHFGAVSPGRWEVPTAPATQEDLGLLLRMDRLLQLTPERHGKRRNDPRFHLGWQHVGVELERAAEHATDSTARRHIEAVSKALHARRSIPHPKIDAVSKAILPLLDKGEKVLVFCHHRATASELLGVLETTLKTTTAFQGSPPEEVWRDAWKKLLLPHEDPLVRPIMDWLCSPGLRTQIGGWLGKPALTFSALADQLRTTRPRNAMSSVPTILESAQTLTKVLLDQQSTSTRAILKSMATGSHAFGGTTSHFPGQLDDGLRVMGAWHHDGHRDPPKTLYTGKPNIVIALFNSPFGPDVLVTTDRLSEGVDLHRCCRHLIHYELDPSPIRTLQRNGRLRRVGSWAALTGQPIEYAYPAFLGTRDERVVAIMSQRLNAFGVLLGGAPRLREISDDDGDHCFTESVLSLCSDELGKLNRNLAVAI